MEKDIWLDRSSFVSFSLTALRFWSRRCNYCRNVVFSRMDTVLNSIKWQKLQHYCRSYLWTLRRRPMTLLRLPHRWFIFSLAFGIVFVRLTGRVVSVNLFSFSDTIVSRPTRIKQSRIIKHGDPLKPFTDTTCVWVCGSQHVLRSQRLCIPSLLVWR